MEAKKKGEAWWMTDVKGGVDWTAVSKAPGRLISGTSAMSIWEVELGKSLRMRSPFSWLLTTQRTE